METLSRLAAALEVAPAALLQAQAPPAPCHPRALRRALARTLAALALVGLALWAAVPAERFAREHYLFGPQMLAALLGFFPACFFFSFSLAGLLSLAGLRPPAPRRQALLRAAAWAALALMLYGLGPLALTGAQALWYYLRGGRAITLSGWSLPFFPLWSRLFFRSWGQLRAELLLVSLLFAFSRGASKGSAASHVTLA